LIRSAPSSSLGQDADEANRGLDIASMVSAFPLVLSCRAMVGDFLMEELSFLFNDFGLFAGCSREQCAGAAC
jgi:hypothetical protein